MSRSKASLWILCATACTLLVMLVLPITPKAPVQTAVVGRGALMRTFAAEGVVECGEATLCYAPVDGRLSEVLVAQGQRVEAGELLARLDASLEQRQMAEFAALLGAAADDPAAGEWLSQGTRALALERAQLIARMEAKQVRAASGGVVDRVYAQPGALVAAGTPLLTLRGDEGRIVATMRAQDAMKLRYGAPAAVYADGSMVATARLTAFEAPGRDEATGAYVQAVVFAPADGSALDDLAGRSVSLEVVWDWQEDVALAPISAIDRDGRLWTVREQKAFAQPVDAGVRNERFVRVRDSLVGQRVVLSPEGLSEGCRVKEVAP